MDKDTIYDRDGNAYQYVCENYYDRIPITHEVCGYAFTDKDGNAYFVQNTHESFDGYWMSYTDIDRNE